MGIRRSRPRKVQFARNHSNAIRKPAVPARGVAADHGQSAIAIRKLRAASRHLRAERFSQPTSPAIPRTLATDQCHMRAELLSASQQTLRSCLSSSSGLQGSPYDTPPTGRVQHACLVSGQPETWHPGSLLSDDIPSHTRTRAFSASMQSLNASVGVVGVSGSGEIPGLQSLLANTHCASAAAEECD
ncbi:hypothetical protein IWW55_004021, partial [Coemansia sp. RSA 2706]